jgi:16S rRNA (guanine966-N2)-methyltransferase
MALYHDSDARYGFPVQPVGTSRVKSQPLRIGGGVFNGRRLQSVPGHLVRPTSGRVRQALFNMLRPVIRDAIFVDLFAGTGSVGLEALSHGARQVYLVEQDRRVVATLRRNVAQCGAGDRATIIAAPLPQAVQRLPATLQADILFLDPPYASELAEQTLAALEPRALLAPVAMVIWQLAVRHPVPQDVLGRRCIGGKRRRYGDTQVSIFAFGEMSC